jgi:hypothetical protein
VKNKLFRLDTNEFFKGRSNIRNLFLEKATESDRGESFDVVHLDFAKAFHTVPRGRQILKCGSKRSAAIFFDR